MRILAVSLLFVVCTSAVLTAQESRTWSDNTGQFKLEAVFVRIEDGKVILKKEDGKTQKVPLDKLCKADQDYIKKQSANPFAENPFEESEDEPPQTKKTTKTAPIGGGGSQKTLFDAPTKRLSLHGVPSITLDNNEAPWSLNIQPVSVTLSKKPRPVTFITGNLPFSAHSHNEKSAFYFDGENWGSICSAQVEFSNSFRNNSKDDENYTQIFVGDFMTGKAVSTKAPQRLTVLGISPDGTKALFSKQEWNERSSFGNKKYLYAVQMAGGRPQTLLAALEPFAENNKSRNMPEIEGDIAWAGWIDNETFLVRSERGHILAYNVENENVLWQHHGESLNKTKFSPDRHYLVASSRHGLYLLETQTGDTIGLFADSEKTAFRGSGAAFSPDGTSIIQTCGGKVFRWDVKTGKMTDSFFIGGNHSNVLWINDDFVLLDNTLVHLGKQMPVWLYNGNSADWYTIGGYVIMTSLGSKKTQYPVLLPQPAVSEVLKLPPEKLFAVRSGMNVSLNIDASIQDGRADIEKKFKEMIAQSGLVLQNGAPLSITLKVSSLPQDILSYRVRLSSVEVTYTPIRYSVEVLREGKVLWEDATTITPPFMLTPDEQNSDQPRTLMTLKNSLQSAADKHMADQKYKDWFLKAEIPKQIPHPNIGGQSIITERGLQDNQRAEPGNKRK